jgi:hypothetical protein
MDVDNKSPQGLESNTWDFPSPDSWDELPVSDVDWSEVGRMYPLPDGMNIDAIETDEEQRKRFQELMETYDVKRLVVVGSEKAYIRCIHGLFTIVTGVDEENVVGSVICGSTSAECPYGEEDKRRGSERVVY